MSSPQLRLGLLLDSYLVPAWIYSAIARITSSEYVQISLIVLRQAERKTPTRKGNLLPRLYTAIDEKIFVRGNSATELRNLKVLLEPASVLVVKPIDTKAGWALEQGDIEKVQSFHLDMLIRIGFDPLCGPILSCPRYGVWEYFSAQKPYGYWEVMQGSAVTQMAVRILPREGRPARTLFSESALTYPFSPTRNSNRSLWKAASFLPRQIEALRIQGEEKFFQQPNHPAEKNSISIPEGQFRPPSIVIQAGWVLRLLMKNAKEMLFRKLNRDYWFLMFGLHEEDEAIPFHEFQRILPPKNRFWADPYVIKKDGAYFVFIEEYAAEKGKGHISVLRVDPSGHVSDAVPVLDQPYHLSYPCVFEWNNHYYMVPESSEHRTIDLYECIRFPTKWVHKKTLMERVNAVDSTLFFYREKWWLFTGISENEGSAPEVELFLFYSDDLLTGEWMSHPLNPLKSDARDSRPAGAIFNNNGKLYRPSQDCSICYGQSFDINEILSLSETEYAEKRVRSVRADWDRSISGTHTFGISGTFKIIDAYTSRPRFARR